MPLMGRRDKRKGGERKKTTLERKTADLREKLAKISFRRNSAPATQGSTASHNEGTSEPEYYGSSGAAPIILPEVLSQLPIPVLELVFDQIPLKVSLTVLSGAADAILPSLNKDNQDWCAYRSWSPPLLLYTPPGTSSS